VDTPLNEFNSKSEDGKTINPALYKLKKLADRGFQVDSVNVKHEWDHIYRIRIMNHGRIVGFFDNKKFIAISYFKKKAQKLNKKQRKIIEKVLNIKNNTLWQIG
jgi:mRNA-degrading endonuclease RelE of RelBE toxin-antitoxin system